MEYNDIKQIIDDNIKTNSSQEITAVVANAVMTAMIDYTRDSFTEVINQGIGSGAFSWLDVEADSVIPYPQMSAGRARVVRIFKDGVEFPEGEATIGGVNGVTIKHHALVICLEATNESANDGSQETVGDRFAVINVDGSGGGMPDVSATERGVVNNEPLQELGGADKLINGIRIGRGNNDIITNLVIGNESLGSNTTGTHNTALGNLSLSYNTTGIHNTALGNLSLSYNTTGIHNTGVGSAALALNTTGDWNSAFGTTTLQNNTTGNKNTGLGTSLFWNSTGSRNTGVGFNAGHSTTTGNDNTYIGNVAGYNNGIGSYNTAIGSRAMITTGGGTDPSTLDMNNNVFIGASLRLTDGVNNVLAIDNKGSTITNYADALLYGNFADRFLRINGRFEVGGSVRAKGFIGRSVTDNVSGSYTVDFDDMAEHYILTMQDNTSIVFDNMISDEETVVITLTVQGNHSLLLPSFLVASPDNDDYDGDLNNEIVINIKRGGANPLGYYTLKNYEI